jgi:hypothetical protein
MRESIKNILFKLKKRSYAFSPVFIIGCGRSGTTILGNTLSQHPQIKYLNERRDLWHRSYPEFDIWNKNMQESKIYADGKDVVNEKNNILYHLFFREQVLGNATVLLEKLPINSFRLKFIEKTFPNARYIYLTRNGLEVSNSIQNAIKKGGWLRAHDLLKSYNIEDGDNNRGIWEWKLSIDKSHSFFSKMRRNRFIHLSYKDFIDSPSLNIQEIFAFLKLDYTEDLINKISKGIQRRNPEIKAISNKDISRIGGDILYQTIDNSYNPFK